MEKKGIYAYGVITTPTDSLKMNNIFLVSYKNLSLVGKMVSIKDFQKKIKKTLKSPVEMEEILKSHQSVLDGLMKKTTVVPFKFGTILKNKKAAAGLLKSSYIKFRRLLTKLKEREEWGVRVFADKERFKTKIKAQAKGTMGKQGTGTAYLLRKKREKEAEEKMEGKLAFFSSKIFAALEKLAFEAKVSQSSQRFSEKGEILVSVFAFLLDKQRVKKFLNQTADLEKKYQGWGLRLTISGPWPAFNFV